MQPRIVVVGSLNMDLVARSPRMPAPGETIMGGPFQTVPGGKGANQAVAAARMGAQVTMVGRVGRDAFGDSLLTSLEVDGIDVNLVEPDPEAATGVALIIVDDGGQNSIVVAPGANARLTRDHINAAHDAIAGADVLLLQLESPLDTVLEAAERARHSGTTIILNPAPAQPLPLGLLGLIDVLVPNETEAALLSDQPVHDLPSAQTAAGVLRREGAGAIVITLGAQGALLDGEGGVYYLPAHEVEVVDTTAAGDAFLGALGHALAAGQSLREAVRWGNAAGALASTRLGAQPSLPTFSEIETLL
jgi:ribokinase